MAEIRMIRLVCPLCVKEGKTEPVETSTDSAWLPALLEKYVPEIKRKEGFISLNEAIAKAPQFEALVDTSGRRREAKVLCFDHSNGMRAAKIWTTKYSAVLEMRARAAANLAAKRAEEQAERERNAFDSIGSILSGKQAAAVSESQGAEPEEDDASARLGRSRKWFSASWPPMPRLAARPMGTGRRSRVVAVASLITVPRPDAKQLPPATDLRCRQAPTRLTAISGSFFNWTAASGDLPISLFN